MADERMTWYAEARLLKFKEDITPYKERKAEAEFYRLFQPFEVKNFKGNCLLQEGINQMFSLICGVPSYPYDNANSLIGVGDGTAIATPNQTALAGGTYSFAAMETGFPSLGAQAARFKSSFGAAIANHAWYEWTIVNGTVSDKNMNRKAENLGVKASGTWTLEVSVTLS